MPAAEGPNAEPLTAVGRREPPPAGGFEIRRDDLGAFRAVEPLSNELLALRPGTDGLAIERREGREIVPWSAVEGITLTFADAGTAKVRAVRVRVASGPALDFADALAPGADDLPPRLEAGAGPLLRVERCRLLTAVIASAAGLAPSTVREFHRGPRGVEVPELAIRPRVLPRWVPPVGLAASVVALVVVFGVRWSTAVAVSAVFVLHELAHAGAMRWVGTKVRGFLFVPLLGAATVPEHGFRSRWDEARVTLAGPASGLPTAGVLALLLATGGAEWISRGALGFALLVALAVNVVNLFPLLPLDGGRILACLAAGLPHPARVAVAFLPIAAAAACAVALASGAGLVVALVFLGVSVASTRVTLRRQRFLAWTEALPQPPAAVRGALRDVTNGFNGRAREDVDGGVAATPLTAPQAVVVASLWIAESFALFAAAAWFLAVHPWVVETLGPGR